MSQELYKIINTLLVLAGLALLAFYGLHLIEQKSGHQDGIDAFAAAKAEFEAGHADAPALEPLPVELPGDRTEVAASTTTADSSPLDSAAPLPDTTGWSQKRIDEYREVIAVSSDNDLPEGIMRIPSVGMEVPVFSGTDEKNLTRGAGRIEGTPLLGSRGNTGIAAHRDGYFRALKDVKLGETIVVETMSGVREYRITDLLIVEPADVYVLAPTERDSITLVTCYPFYFVGSAPQRYIVRAEDS